MKNYHILLFSACMMLSSCALQVTYFGDKLPPTSSVDIFYSAHDVTRSYKVIGHLTCANAGKQENVKAQLLAHAQTIGADAIIISGTDATKDNQAAVVNADALKYDK